MTITLRTVSPRYQYIDFKAKDFPSFFKRPIEFEAFREFDEIEFSKCYLDDQNSIKATRYKNYFRVYLPLGTMPDGEYVLMEQNETSENLVFSKK